MNIIFENENFEMVSFNCDRLVLLNKIMYILNALLIYLNTWKRSPRMLGMWWNVKKNCPPNKIPYFCMHWRVVKKFNFLILKQIETHLLINFTFIHNVWIWIQVVHGWIYDGCLHNMNTYMFPMHSFLKATLDKGPRTKSPRTNLKQIEPWIRLFSH